MSNATVATCTTCGTGFDAVQIELYDTCPGCGKRFWPRERDDREPLPTAELRRRVEVARSEADAERALALLEDLPPVFTSLGELSRAVIALLGECRCAVAPVRGVRPTSAEPCPHRRARRALAHVGVRDVDIEAQRRSLGLVMR